MSCCWLPSQPCTSSTPGTMVEAATSVPAMCTPSTGMSIRAMSGGHQGSTTVYFVIGPTLASTPLKYTQALGGGTTPSP